MHLIPRRHRVEFGEHAVTIRSRWKIHGFSRDELWLEAARRLRDLGLLTDENRKQIPVVIDGEIYWDR